MRSPRMTTTASLRSAQRIRVCWREALSAKTRVVILFRPRFSIFSIRGPQLRLRRRILNGGETGRTSINVSKPSRSWISPVTGFRKWIFEDQDQRQGEFVDRESESADIRCRSQGLLLNERIASPAFGARPRLDRPAPLDGVFLRLRL